MTLYSGPNSLQGAWPWWEAATARGVDPRVVASFPTFVYSEVKELKIGECALECAICLNEFEDKETLQLLPKCRHVFHPDCIQSWLSFHVTCPVCRADLLSGLGQTSHQLPVLSQASVLDPDIPPTDDDEIVARVQSPDEITVVDSLPKTLPPRSTSRKERRSRNTFQKSFSTGHSLVLPVENCERYTLRLPDEVLNQLVSSGLERARSCHMTFPRERSGRKGFRITSNGGDYDRFDQEGWAHRWVFTATPPFFSRAGPSRPILTNDSGSGAGTTPIGLLKSVTSPFNRFFRSPNVRKNDVAAKERFTDVLVLDGKV